MIRDDALLGTVIIIVISNPGVEVDERTLHSPIDSWSFHLESTWTHGVHLESRWNLFGREPSQIFVYFHLDSTWIPPHSTSLYTVFFTFPWTPPGLHLDSSSLNNIFCRYWFTNENQVT